MLSWALRFFVAALAAAIVAYSDLGDGFTLLAKLAGAVLLALCSVSLLAALGRPR